MKRLGIFVLLTSLAGGVFAQDLDTVSFTDHLNSGHRGNNAGRVNWTGGSSGSSNPNGSEYEEYSGPDLDISITTSVRYINTWGSANLAGAGPLESPVVNITAPVTNPDRPNTSPASILPAIAPNPFHTPGGDTAVLIGDDGGHNGLYFGDTDDSDYYVEVDMFCPVATVGTGFEVAGLVVRAGRDNDPNMGDYTFNPDRAGSYSIFYDYQNKEVKAVKWHQGNLTADIQNRLASTYTQYGSTVTGVTDGWHTLKIEANGDNITFWFDGNEIASITDADDGNAETPPNLTHGRPGIYYRENGVTSQAERQGVFDNLRAGPAGTSDVSDWNLY